MTKATHTFENMEKLDYSARATAKRIMQAYSVEDPAKAIKLHVECLIQNLQHDLAKAYPFTGGADLRDHWPKRLAKWLPLFRFWSHSRARTAHED